MENTSHMISLEIARALVARGWSVVPTAGDEEKRPLGTFATAKSWRDFSERLPTDAELLGWFGQKPRRGGVVLHKGQLCVDHDTKEGMPCKCENVEVSNSQQPISNVVWEESAKGWHEFYRCDENARIEHDHEAKIDYLTWGSFVRLCDPRCLIDWAGELPEFSSGSSGASDSRTTRASSGSREPPLPRLPLFADDRLYRVRDARDRQGGCARHRLLGAPDRRRRGRGRIEQRPRLGLLPEGEADLGRVQCGDGDTAPHAEVGRQRKAVLRGRGSEFAPALCADDCANRTGQVGRLLVQRPLPRIRRSVQTSPAAQAVIAIGPWVSS